MSEYKRGTETIDGRKYGFYPDGTRYRIFDSDRPFIEFVDVGGETRIRVRQATELGYAEVSVGGCVDLAYPASMLRRARTIAGGTLANALTCGQQLHTLVEYA